MVGLEICNTYHYACWSKSFGDEGCIQLAKMQSDILGSISLRGNNIGPDGCLALTKSNWAKILMINFGCYLLRKELIKSETKDAII